MKYLYILFSTIFFFITPAAGQTVALVVEKQESGALLKFQFKDLYKLNTPIKEVYIQKIITGDSQWRPIATLNLTPKSNKIYLFTDNEYIDEKCTQFRVVLNFTDGDIFTFLKSGKDYAVQVCPESKPIIEVDPKGRVYITGVPISEDEYFISAAEIINGKVIRSEKPRVVMIGQSRIGDLNLSKGEYIITVIQFPKVKSGEIKTIYEERHVVSF